MRYLTGITFFEWVLVAFWLMGGLFFILRGMSVSEEDEDTWDESRDR